MSASTSGQATKVSFPNQLTSMAGLLFIPANMDKTKKYPALAVAHPFGGVKEQTAGTYARRMAEKDMLRWLLMPVIRAKAADILGTPRTQPSVWRTSAARSTT
jgi:hypothetical protein